jgi:uncharacterized membrane protein YeaQ/YmgE (transglycosylase-associated protein family)
MKTPFSSWKYRLTVVFMIVYGTIMLRRGYLYASKAELVMLCLYPFLLGGLIGILFNRSAKLNIRLILFTIVGSIVWLFLFELFAGSIFNFLDFYPESDFLIPQALFLYDCDSFDGTRYPSGIFYILSYCFFVLFTGWLTYLIVKRETTKQIIEE